MSKTVLQKWLFSTSFFCLVFGCVTVCLAIDNVNWEDYYGFGEMEVLKLGPGIDPPLVCDINHDGLNDLILLNNRNSRLDLLLQKKNFDPGTVELEPQEDDINDIFAREKNWRFKRVLFPLNWQVESVQVGDFNNDHILDFALYTRDEGLRLILQEKPDQSKPSDSKDPVAPQWKPDRKIDIREGLPTSSALACGDLNHDQKDDLVVLAQDSVFVLLQGQDGLSEPVRHYSASGKLRQVDIADVNGDKRDDLVLLTAAVEDYPVRVRLQTAHGSLGPEIRLEMPFALSMETAPLAKDRVKSIFTTIAAKSHRIVLYQLSQQEEKRAKPVLTYPLPTAGKKDNVDIAAADINGDGLLDMIVTSPDQATFWVCLADGKGRLSDPETFPGFRDMRGVVAFRQPGESKDRLAVFSYDEKLIGLTHYENGRLIYPQTVQLAGEPQAFDAMDFDGDGRQDLVYVFRDEKKAYHLGIISHPGTDQEKAQESIPLNSLRDKPVGMCGVDIDHNGKTDVLIFQPYKPLLLYRNPQGEETRKGINAGLVSDIAPKAVSVANLGADGGQACLVAQKNFARAIVFDAEKGWQVVDQFQAEQDNANLTTALACQIITETPGLEIVTYDNARGELSILVGDEDGIYRMREQIEIGSILERKIVCGNFGGGTPSLMLCGADKLIQIPMSGQVALASQVAAYDPVDEDKTRYGLVVTGDVNNDNYPEILAVDHAGNHIDLLTFDEQGTLVRAYRLKVFEEADLAQNEPSLMDRRTASGGEPRSVKIGDVTGDGKNDLVVMVHDRLIIYPQD